MTGQRYRVGDRTWVVVARLMAGDARRSRGLVAVVVLFGVVAMASVTLPAAVVGETLSGNDAMVYLVAPMKVLVALSGLLAGYGAIAGPRTRGQLVLLLSLPVERSAFVLGAFVGRSAVVLAGVVVGLAVAGGGVRLAYGDLPVDDLAALGGLLALLAVAVTGLAVGLSAAARTRGRAAVGAIAAFVLFQFFWGIVPIGVHYLVEGTLPGAVVPPWVVLIERLQPLAAFEAMADHALPAVPDAVQLSAGGAETAAAARPPPVASRLDGSIPVYLNPWAGVVTLVGWAVGPLVVGGYRFERTDL